MTTVAARQTLSKKSQSFYRPELDVLRFFAFLAVFIFHVTFRESGFYTARGVPGRLAALLAAVSSAGNMGVDLFFLLSAYLITTLLLREKESMGTVNLRSFYIRRILRIWPLYFLALGLGAFWFVVSPGDYFPRKYVVAYLFLVGNWMYAYGTPGSPFALLWSVAVEEQFYLSWPALLRKLSSRKGLAIFALSLLCFTIGVRTYVSGGKHVEAVLSNTFTRLDGIALGILIAAWIGSRIPSRGGFVRVVLLAAGLVGFLFVGGLFTDGLPSVSIRLTAAAVASALFFFAILGANFAPKPLVYLGKISYGLYIYHALCIRISGFFLGDRMKSYFGYLTHISLSLAVTIVVASLSYRFFESPFLRLKEHFTNIESRPV